MKKSVNLKLHYKTRDISSIKDLLFNYCYLLFNYCRIKIKCKYNKMFQNFISVSKNITYNYNPLMPSLSNKCSRNSQAYYTYIIDKLKHQEDKIVTIFRTSSDSQKALN